MAPSSSCAQLPAHGWMASTVGTLHCTSCYCKNRVLSTAAQDGAYAAAHAYAAVLLFPNMSVSALQSCSGGSLRGRASCRK